MNTQTTHACTCASCPGASCTCGCQNAPAPKSSCGCGCQQGRACQCGPAPQKA